MGPSLALNGRPVEVPLLQSDGGFPEADVFHQRDEVDDVAAAATTAEAVETVLARGNSERGRILALVDGAGTRDPVAVLLEGGHQPIVFENLDDADPGFDILEVHIAKCWCLIGFH